MYEYKGTVVKVVDGDTLDILIDLGFSVSFKQRFRLLGIDCQETKLIRNTTEEGKGIGIQAKDFVKKLFESNTEVMLKSEKTDKYGRYLATVFCKDDSGEFSVNLKDILLEKGFNR